MVNFLEKVVVYILIFSAVGFAGFMAYKSFTNQAQIVEAKGDALYETIKTPFESTFGTKDDPTKVVFKKGDSVLTFNLPYENIEWIKTSNGLTAKVDNNKSFEYKILDNGRNNPVGIKENIVLNEKPESNEFMFSLDLRGLKAIRNGGLWRFYDDSGKEIFYIPEPYMEDASGEQSKDVEITIENGKLIVSANKDWLNSDERQYPIKIDPSLELTVLTVQSYPEKGEIWDVEFTTVGKSDLKIIPNDQQTIDDMDFVSLTCDGQKRSPRILRNDVIFYRNWECDGIGKIEHKITKQGNHELMFEFGNQVDYAHNANWLGNWENRIKITVDNTNIDSDLTHFPIPIFLSTSSGQSNDDVSAVFDEVGSNYQKIAITKDDGAAQLYVEKEKWDVTAEEAVLWVSKDDLTLSSSSTTDLYLYYDSAQSDNTAYIASAGSRTEVWDSNYMGVWHLSESGATQEDSTSNDNDETAYNGDPTESATGKIGNAVSFDGNDALYSSVDTIFGLTNKMTIEAWAYPTTNQTNRNIANHSSSSGNKYSLYVEADSGRYTSHTNTGTHIYVRSDDEGDGYWNNTWAYVVGTYDGTLSPSQTRFAYLNGLEVGTPTGTPSANLYGGDNRIYIGDRQATDQTFTGSIDEVRVSDISRSADWIKATYYAQTDDFVTFGAPTVYSSWVGWLGTWENRIEITVDNTNIDSDLDHFPVPIFLGTSVGQGSDDVSAVFDEVGSSWQKIAVTKNDGTSQLYVEKELWDDTGETAVLWVSNSGFTLPSSSTTTLYLYYDAAQDDNTLYTGDVGSRTEVWDDNFIGVYHLAEDPSGAAPQMIDSTLQGLNGTSSGTMTSGDLVDGIVGDSLDFDGSDDYISVSDSAIHDTAGEVTVQANINTTASLGSVGLALHDLSDYKYLLYLTNSSTTGIFYIRTASGIASASYAGAAGYFSDGNDHFLTGTFDKSLGSNRITLYENGTSLNSGNGYAEDISTGNEGLTIGQWNSNYYTDILDEVRVSDVARSAAWVKADYYAQDDNLLTFTTPTTYSAPAATTVSWLPNWSKRMKITIDNSNIDSNLTHFPIPIILSTSSGQYSEDVSAIFDELATNWQKIAVTEDDGITQLYVEKEMWDDTGEEAVLWVSRSDFTLSSTDTTDLYLYYDSTQSNNNDYVGGEGSGQDDRTEVWDSSFEAVWHMADSSGSIKDSTSNDNDISESGNPTYEQTGQIGYAIDFDGTGDYFHDATILDSDAQNQSQTVSVLIKAERSASDNYVIGTDTNAGYYIRIEDNADAEDPNKVIVKIDDTVDDDFGWSNKDVVDATAAWHRVAQKIDTSSSEHIGFLDGTPFYTGTTTSIGDLDDELIIGGRWNTGGGIPAGYFTGLLDEVRVSSTARSSAWVKADYYAQSDLLIDYGTEEESSAGSSSGGGGNYFGDSSDGTGSFSTNTSFSNTADGDYVVKQYDGLTIDSGVTVTTANRAKGLMILVDGDATINGTLSMTDRGASADPVTAGVSATGLRLPMVKSGETDTLAAADFSGAGTTVQSVVSNQSGIDGDGKIYQIPRTGAGGANGTTGAGNDGTTGTSGQTGGGGSGGGGSNASGDGGDGTAFSGGSASGGEHWGTGVDASDTGGAGSGGSCYYSACGGGAGNGGGSGCCYGGVCSSGSYGNDGQDGTGGVVWLIVNGDLTIGASGVIEANGSNGGNTVFTAGGGGANGGGGSAGGTIIVLYSGTLSNSGTLEAAGGSGGTSNTSKPGGDGGDGSVIIEQVAEGNTAPTTPTSLKTEGQVNPTNITDSTPEFTAVYNDSTGDIANKYQIQVDDDSDFSSTIWDSGSSGTAMTNCTAGNECSEISYAGSSLSEDITYYWRIKFWDDDGVEGSWSTETATFSLILIPTSCRVKEISQNGSNYDITLEWTDNSSTETGFEIDKNTDGAGWTDLTTTAADTTTYTDSNQTTESTYAYRVRANAASGDSDWCYISGYDLNTGNFNFEGLDFEGINID